MLGEAGCIAEDLLSDLKARISKLCTEEHNRILIMGCTYKADINDIRNSVVLDLAVYLDEYTKANVYIYDPVYTFKYGDPYPTYHNESEIPLIIYHQPSF